MERMSNERAEAHFVRSGLAEVWRPIVNAEAHYMMSSGPWRYSDAVHSAIQQVRRDPGRLASPVASGMAQDSGLLLV
jgi:hypothetical protein